MFQQYDSLRDKAVKFADYDYINLAVSMESALPVLAPFERFLLTELFINGTRIETLTNELSLSATTLFGIANSSLNRLRDDLNGYDRQFTEEGVTSCPTETTSTNNVENV